jgi:hypothetical protein
MHSLLLFLLILTSGAAEGQIRTGSIAGLVTDATGAVPGAKVIALHLATGRESVMLTERDGRYTLPRLDPGQYHVTAQKDGYRTSRHEDVLLEMDRSAVVNHHLEIGTITESIVVRGEARLIESTPSALSSVVDGRTIEQLPLNGRDYLQLATIQPGVVIARATDRDADTGYGVQLSFSGSRPFQNSVRVDGLTITTYNGSTPGSTNGLNLGVDATAEFSVQASTYSAQYGQSGGGIINAVTRAGSNDLHGTAFFFHRNDNLDARNHFDPGEKPEFRRHQFGTSLGGPIRRNRSFFFANYEGLRQQRDTTTVSTTFSADARAGVLTSGRVNVDPVMARFASLYPLPNGPVLGDTGLFLFANPIVSDQNFVTGRFDQNVGEFDKFFLRYSWDKGQRDNLSDFAVGRRENSTHNQSAVFEHTHIFSPRLLNTARAGFLRYITRDGANQTLNPGTDDPAFAFVPFGGVAGVVTVGGLTDFPGGTNASNNDRNTMNSYQLSDDVDYNRGRHSLKFGGRIERTHFNADSQNRQYGDFRFASISTFLRNAPNRFRAQMPGSDTIRGQRQWIPSFYVQDTWQVHRRVSLDIGMRWEAATIPTEVNGKVANLVRLTDTAMRLGDPLFQNPSWKNFVPRTGIAWDLFGSGATMLRGGYGLYPDLILTPYITFSGIRNSPFFVRAETRALAVGAFPKGGFTALVATPTLEVAAERLDPNPEQPRVHQWNVNIEQSFGAETAFRIAYVGSHGRNLSSVVSDANLVQPVVQPDGRLFFPANGTVINPSFGQIRNRNFDAQSFYNGLQTSFRRRMSGGLQTQVSYTLGKSIDDSSNFFTSSESANRGLLAIDGNPTLDRGLSGHDVRHTFNASGIWELPLRAGRGWKAIAGGWQAGGIVSASSGLPTTVWLGYDAARTRSHQSATSVGQRPDLAPGVTSVATGDPNRWVDINAFRRPTPGYLGNLGRNTVGGPGLANVDFSLVKRIPVSRLGEGAAIDLRFEFFNILNHTNFNMPDLERMESFTETATREDFGRITSALQSREIQFGLRLRF